MASSTHDTDVVQETNEDQETREEDVAEEMAALPLDQVFEILKNSRRREVLHYLREHDHHASLSDLAEHIAAIENDTTVEAISSSQRKRVYVGLYQCHLPKMDDMDIVEFDQNRGDVQLADNADQLEQYISTEGPSRSWHRLYLGLAVAAAVAFVVTTGTTSLAIGPMAVLAALLVGIAVCAGYHTYLEELVDE